MWIRSQDDRLLIDANKIYVGGTDDPKYQMGDFKYRIYNIGESCNYFLGDYSSKEKALKVLDEIQTCIMTEHHYHTDDANCTRRFFTKEWKEIYQMPQDEDVEV